MEKFTSWFCLNERSNFTINPQITPQDSQYYFGRDDIKKQLQKQIRRSFTAPGVPKLMVWGPYGSGKTQTLFYLKHFLETEKPEFVESTPRIIYLTIELRDNSSASDFHMQLMEQLGKETVTEWVKKLFERERDFESVMRTISDNDENTMNALKELRVNGDSALIAWRWLTGQKIPDQQLSTLNLTRNIGINTAQDLVQVLVAIGALASMVGEMLVFMIDELEQLLGVRTGNASESIHSYVRYLADPSNPSVGFLIGFKADVLDDAPEVLRRGDIHDRIGAANYIDIPPLPAVADVKTFIIELLKHLTKNDEVELKISEKGLDSEVGVFPFSRPALELLADYATQDPSRALPRNIIHAINECAIEAWDEGKAVIDEIIVNSVAPHVFQ